MKLKELVKYIPNLLILIFLIGIVFLGGLYFGMTQHHGFWTRDAMGFSGSWVHVNINKMNFQEALEICRHEVGHEIFAGYCQESPENFEKCVEATEK